MSHANLRKLDRMGVLSFQNALRLHEDAILLFKNQSHASAYGLSVLSLEELGKYLVLEDLVWRSRTEGRYPPDQEEAIVRLTYDHRYKQNKFAVYVELPMFARKAIQRIFDGSVEKAKQNAFYVGLPRKGRKVDLKARIASPFKTTKKQTETQITVVNDFLLVLTAGSVKGTHIVDIEELEGLLTHRLIDRLQGLWPKMGRDARRDFRKIMRFADRTEDE
ncbi:MAG: AbiV family abortive infection protein [Sulfuricaulis sp.]|uniref:AbiV family abortive infection protein n=1 Tax=Sulfuricaulis sp. TaxID=2003553 RepID=UPI0034A0ED5C